MTGLSPRTRLIAWLLVAGVGLALFFSGNYRDIPFPLGWFGTVLFVAAVWSSVAALQRVPHSDEETAIAPGEWQAWVGVAFVSAVIVATMLDSRLFLPQVPLGENHAAAASARGIGTLFVAWLVLSSVLKRRWSGTVLSDERDARIQLVAGQWARGATTFCLVGIAALLGFGNTGYLRGLSYPYIAQLLVQALLWGLWFEQVVAAVLYWRDRRSAA